MLSRQIGSFCLSADFVPRGMAGQALYTEEYRRGCCVQIVSRSLRTVWGLFRASRRKKHVAVTVVRPHKTN